MTQPTVGNKTVNRAKAAGSNDTPEKRTGGGAKHYPGRPGGKTELLKTGAGYRPYLAWVEQLAGIKDSAREKFNSDLFGIIGNASFAASEDPALLKGAKKAARLARQLQVVLEKSGLSQRFELLGPVDTLPRQLDGGYRLPLRWYPNVAHLAFLDVSDLAKKLHEFEKRKKSGRPKQWAETIRKQFVYDLLDTVHAAGGELGLNRRSGRGSLVNVLRRLRPSLPPLFKHGLSAPTLRQIKTAWLKNQKNRSKKHIS